MCSTQIPFQFICCFIVSFLTLANFDGAHFLELLFFIYFVLSFSMSKTHTLMCSKLLCCKFSFSFPQYSVFALFTLHFLSLSSILPFFSSCIYIGHVLSYTQILCFYIFICSPSVCVPCVQVIFSFTHLINFKLRGI